MAFSSSAILYFDGYMGNCLFCAWWNWVHRYICFNNLLDC